MPDHETGDTATVTMFSTPWCGYCRRLKVLMDAEGIPFVEVNIDQDRAAEDYVMAVNGDGTATVPTLRFPDGSALSNPTFAQIKQRLAAAG